MNLCKPEIEKEYKALVETRSIVERDNLLKATQEQNKLLQEQIALMKKNSST